jgi:hypothetical protein
LYIASFGGFFFIFLCCVSRRRSRNPLQTHRRSLPTGPNLVPSYQKRLSCQVRHHEIPMILCVVIASIVSGPAVTAIRYYVPIGTTLLTFARIFGGGFVSVV